MAVSLSNFVGQPEAAPAHKIKVVTSFLPLYCFSANIAGDLAQVENLLPPGASPHDYDFSPSDLRRLKDADLIILNGLGLEDWLEKAFPTTDRKTSAQVVEVATGLGEELITENQSNQDEPRRKESATHSENGNAIQANPHIWLDPKLALHSVTNILRALQKADPAHAEIFARNAAAYATRLEKLDADLQAGLAPFTNAPFVTLHQAFPYFTRRYGLKVAGVIETTPEVEPSSRHLHKLAGIVREQKVKAIFTEVQSPSKLARQFARDLHISVAELDTLETGSFTLTAYEDGMRKNLEILRQALK